MQWKLAHFGLELNPPEDIIKLSSVEIRDVLPFKAVGQPEENLRSTVLDPILNGPPLEETLLNTIGHIKLAVPVARPECMDQIVEQINKSRPLKFPLQKFGKSKSAQFHYDLGAYNDKASEEELVVNPNDIHDAFNPKFGGSNRPIVIHGDQFTEHNVEAEPRLMFLTVLPVPSIVARPNDGDSLHPLTKKLNTIVRMNSFIENAIIDENVPEMILKDMVSLLTYHVLTYLDNAIPGIPSDDELQAGIAQMLGSDVDVISEAPTEADIAGTTLHRIVRGINMGEAVILVNQNTDDAQSLSFELTKQVAFNRVWKKSGRDTQVVHINSYGEIYRMDIGTIENYDWTLWDGSRKIPREVVVAPRGSPRLIDAPMAGRLSRVVQQLQLIDEDFRLELKEQLALNYLYSICEIGQELQEQLIRQRYDYE